jgi:hypothetical protein
MKKIIFSIAILCTGLITLSFRQTETDFGLARVGKIYNKLVFLWSEPVHEYESAFTFQNSIVNYDCLSPEQIMTETIKNANAEAANQGKIYDAIICVNGSPRDMAITWKDKTLDNTIARVQRMEGKFVFVQCEPLSSYDVTYKCNVAGRGRTCPTHQQKLDKLIKKAYRNQPNFDGIMYGSSLNDLAIKFK